MIWLPRFQLSTATMKMALAALLLSLSRSTAIYQATVLIPARKLTIVLYTLFQLMWKSQPRIVPITLLAEVLDLNHPLLTTTSPIVIHNPYLQNSPYPQWVPPNPSHPFLLLTVVLCQSPNVRIFQLSMIYYMLYIVMNAPSPKHPWSLSVQSFFKHWIGPVFM